VRFKKLGVITLTAAISISSFTTAAFAESISASMPTKQITVAEKAAQEIKAEESNVKKEELIKRIHELFPNQFKDFKDEDFRLEPNRYYHYSEEERRERYYIYFHKEISKGKYINGGIEFEGKELELVGYHNYSSTYNKDAYYPAKVSKDDAKKLAEEFIARVKKDATYQVVVDEWEYHHSTNKTLTEPVRYSFHFERIVNGVPVRGFGGNVEVLGNGEIIGFWSGESASQATFEAKKDLLAEEKIVQKLKENLNLQLRYITDYDYRNEEVKVYLAYVPIPEIQGILATSGKWFVNGKFVDQLPKAEPIKMLADKPKDIKQKKINADEAKKIAEELLKPSDDKVKLVIDGVYEHTNHLKEVVYSVHYMYHIGNAGHGGSLEITKSGEILGFHNYGGGYEQVPTEKEPKITYDQALEKAVQYLEKYAPSKLHKHSYPTVKLEIDKYSNSYQFNFPRVENNIPFLYESIGVNISAEDGSLVGLFANSIDAKNLPSAEGVVEKEVAEKAFYDKLELNLVYAAEWNSKNRNDYKLVYELNNSPYFKYLDAKSGEWKTPESAPKKKEEQEEKPRVKHAWAEKELNFMIDANILTVKDYDSFNPNAAITKGEGLEMLLKSLTRFWDGPMYYGENKPKPTFENIGVDHPLFEVVERAVHMGIIDPKEKTFDLDSNLTRQELAAWYVKALRLHEAAKHSDIYYVKFKDADQVDAKYKGHVALASAFGILTGSQEKFNPKAEVTIAQMAVATFRMADTINTLNAESNNYNHRYYY